METAAKAFEKVKALALDPKNAMYFVWITKAAVEHYEQKILEMKDRILREERFGQEKSKSGIHWLKEYQKCLDIANALAEWVQLSEIEQSAPAIVEAVMQRYRKPDIDISGRKTEYLGPETKDKQ